jgi:hypothetical protein
MIEQEILPRLQKQGGILDLWSLAEVTTPRLDRGAWLLGSLAETLIVTDVYSRRRFRCR